MRVLLRGMKLTPSDHCARAVHDDGFRHLYYRCGEQAGVLTFRDDLVGMIPRRLCELQLFRGRREWSAVTLKLSFEN